MKRLLRRIAFAAAGCVLVVTLVGCDVIGTLEKSGVTPSLTKHRFGVQNQPRPEAVPLGDTASVNWVLDLPGKD